MAGVRLGLLICYDIRFPVRALRGRLTGLSVSQSKSVLNGAFVWARMALNRIKRRFPAHGQELCRALAWGAGAQVLLHPAAFIRDTAFHSWRQV